MSLPDAPQPEHKPEVLPWKAILVAAGILVMVACVIVLGVLP